MKNKEIVLQALSEVIAGEVCNEAKIAQYFSLDYSQNVDGIELDYTQFLVHVIALKKVLEKVVLKVLAIAENQDDVLTHHHVFATKYDGSTIHTQVLAHFKLSEGKIIQCTELTYLLKGSEEDKNLGSRL